MTSAFIIYIINSRLYCRSPIFFQSRVCVCAGFHFLVLYNVWIVSDLWPEKLESNINSRCPCFIQNVSYSNESQDPPLATVVVSFSIVCSTGTRHWTDLIDADMGVDAWLNLFGFFNSVKIASSDDSEKLSSSSSSSWLFRLLSFTGDSFGIVGRRLTALTAGGSTLVTSIW